MAKQTSASQFYLIILLIFFGGFANAQTYLYFQDSPDPVYYDYSWLWVNAPSELEVAGSDDHRFPVETATAPQQGMNALRLSWKSAPGGNWQAIAAGAGWQANDVSDTDTLMFFLFAPQPVDVVNLPAVFLEDTDNLQSFKTPISEHVTTLPSQQWIRIVIPMQVFFDASPNVNFNSIKTIGFAQHQADNANHILYVDDMRIFKGDGTSPPVSAPQGLTAKGYDSHVYLTWNPNPEPNLNGYEIYQSTNNGVNFIKRAVVGKDEIAFSHFVRHQGTNLNLKYKITALNDANQPSEFSEIVDASTYDMTDDELLEMVQEATFRYFYDFAHPVSGMARERNTSGNTVTSGGTGFGIMALLVGIERGFITREQGIEHVTKIINFLEDADRFHGVWPHWMNGNTGTVIPFSQKDNGGDLVETAFLLQGLLAARQYFTEDVAAEQYIVEKITQLWETVEWDWYRRSNGNFLYWHWSPNYGWDMNMQVKGPNEAAIIYLLAIASPTHGVPASLWHDGWASSPYYVNGNSFYGYPLWVGWNYGGPLFFAHYSYIGFDPRNLKDQYANYFLNNRNHTLINRAYCIANPKGFEGYGENSWGLTASDDPFGYMAHEPFGDRDNGTITPTAALSSMPYTPQESMAALKHFYRNLGSKTWGNYGFYDAFNIQLDWYADSYLAIDQGPIIDMIENHRSQLLWNLFMANPEIQPALDAIGFEFDPQDIEELQAGNFAQLKIYPNPASQQTNIEFTLQISQTISIVVSDIEGRQTHHLIDKGIFTSGKHALGISLTNFVKGVYFIQLVTEMGTIQEKLILL